MNRLNCTCLFLLLLTSASLAADPKHISALKPAALYEEVIPSLVAVQYSWANELRREELIGAGIVVAPDLVMISLAMVPSYLPDNQLKDFKIIVPQKEGNPEEIDAIFQGRDERTHMAFVKPASPQHWKPIVFEDAKVEVGQRVFSVGILPKAAAYKSYLMESKIAAELRGEMPQVLVQGAGLAATGSPVFNEAGKAIGISIAPNETFLNRNEDAMASINNPPKIFTPARFFLLSLSDPPSQDKPIVLPWVGIAQMTGLSKDVAEALGLKDKPAIQIGEVLPNTAAEKAGLKSGDIILSVNGEPLERGDEASELPGIFNTRMLRHKVGDVVTFSVLRGDSKPIDIKVKLEERLKQSNLAKRFYAEDMGFVARELVFNDTYTLKLPADQKGALVDIIRPQSAAQNAGLHRGDIILRMNNQPLTDIEEFETLYKKTRKDQPRSPLVLVVHRRTGEDTIRIEPPQ
jgi:S1-C subfamily serine protease